MKMMKSGKIFARFQKNRGGGSSGSSSEEEEEEWADIRPLSERIGGCQ